MSPGHPPGDNGARRGLDITSQALETIIVFQQRLEVGPQNGPPVASAGRNFFVDRTALSPRITAGSLATISPKRTTAAKSKAWPSDLAAPLVVASGPPVAASDRTCRLAARATHIRHAGNLGHARQPNRQEAQAEGSAFPPRPHRQALSEALGQVPSAQACAIRRHKPALPLEAGPARFG